MTVDAPRPIFSRPVIVVIALVMLAIASVTVLIVRSAPNLVVVGTVRSIGTHRLCVSAKSQTTCVEADSPRSIEGFAPGDCVRVTSSSNGTLVNVQQVAPCPLRPSDGDR